MKQIKFSKLKSICEGAGYSLDDAVKITIFLTDLGNFAVVDDVMKEHFLSLILREQQ